MEDTGASAPKRNKFKDLTIETRDDATMIVLPKGMDEDRAIKELQDAKREKETVVNIAHQIEAYPLDAALALSRAIVEIYGKHKSVMGWVGPESGHIRFPTSATEFTDVPWGRIALPGIDGTIQLSVGRDPSGLPILTIAGQVRKKSVAQIGALVDRARVLVLESSVYKGKAMRVKFQDPDEKFDAGQCPNFIDTSRTDVHQAIFSDKVQRSLDANIFGVIRFTRVCRMLKIPLKRGALLAGRYGVGKTLIAAILARICEENHWTFIELANIEQLAQGLLFARRYQPAVVFSEDVDGVVSGERSITVNEILNTLDGVVSKDSEILTVLTTNHPERINDALMREGRLDLKLLIEPPDAATVARLIRSYAGPILSFTADLKTVSEMLAGRNPAKVREVVERSKLEAVRRLGEGALNDMKLVDEDFIAAATDVLGEEKLSLGEIPDARSAEEKANDVLGRHIITAVGAFARHTNGDTSNIHAE